MSNGRDNLLRAVRFDRPDHIPMEFHINPACWHHYPQDALQELMASHRLLFPDFVTSAQPIEPTFAPSQRAGRPHVDEWGCVWETMDNGITGTVTHHPLANWDDLADFSPPEPQQAFDADAQSDDPTAQVFRAATGSDGIARGGLRHGHTFLTLTDLRGYENLLFDMVDEDSRLDTLIGMVEDYNMAVVMQCLELGAQWVSYPEDLGMQVGPMLSPDQFRRYIKPSYQRLMAPAREAGCIVHMHSDGDIRQLVDDLIDGGVEIINLQDLVNGIDWIKENLAGRHCIELDIDRQQVTRFGSPSQIDALIREEVTKLGSRQGGLMMIHGLYPGVPLANVKALMDAMEQYATYYS